MEKLRACVLIFCAACVVSGIVERISVSKRRFPVIKLAAAMYIVSAVFAPFADQGAAPGTWEPDIPALADHGYAVPDTRGAVLAAAQKTLERTASDALAAAGIICEGVHVTLREGERGVTIDRVTLSLPDTDEAAEAEETVRGALGDVFLNVECEKWSAE